RPEASAPGTGRPAIDSASPPRRLRATTGLGALLRLTLSWPTNLLVRARNPLVGYGAPTPEPTTRFRGRNPLVRARNPLVGYGAPTPEPTTRFRGRNPLVRARNPLVGSLTRALIESISPPPEERRERSSPCRAGRRSRPPRAKRRR